MLGAVIYKVQQLAAEQLKYNYLYFRRFFAALGPKFRDVQKMIEPVKTSMHSPFEDQRHKQELEEVKVRSGGNYVDGFLVLPIKRQQCSSNQKAAVHLRWRFS